ncbi:recombinase family protein [Vibrio nitrifigilis]|uniref:Recombinase family protein n=1 Tax=Vibrio nitrifigilis TaxID=2789781 RepID=A0ABS0GBS4_9VIBR|nr:recombinase family protein [Vibrio nitrifigilis]MBF8999868.1 recombinase family protein [Vibrio nitrifigilis]
MSHCYGYIRVSPKIKDIDSRIEALKTQYQDIELFVETGIKGGVPLSERPKFQELDAKLENGDELVVWWIDELGKEFSHCLNNIKTLIDKGITIKSNVESLEFKLNDNISDALIKMLKGYAESEKHRRLFAAELGRRALKQEPGHWKEKFRGRQKNEGQHQEIAQALFEGKTLQAVADETGASLSTVKRVKAKIKQQDELGTLRGRGHGGRGHGGKGHGGRGHGSRGDGSRDHGKGMGHEKGRGHKMYGEGKGRRRGQGKIVPETESTESE